MSQTRRIAVRPAEPIVRCLALAAALAATGCLGNFDLPGDGSDGGAPVPPSPDAGARDGASNGGGGDMATTMGSSSGRTLFDTTVNPMLTARCTACHGKAGDVGPPFLAPVTYDTLIAYPGVVVTDPTTSKLMTKGPHNGCQWFNTTEQGTVLAWLTLEAMSLNMNPNVTQTTAAQSIAQGANTVSLGQLSADLAGATITFNASFVGSTLELSSITVNAKGANGVHIVHPLFITISSGAKTPDPVDSFSNLDQSVAQGNSSPLGPGTLFLDRVGTLDQLQIAFKTIEKYSMGGGGDGGVVGGGGCKDTAGFTANVKPTLSGNCVGCHGGNNLTATNALDMTSVNDTSQTGQDTACAQVKNRIDVNTPANSDVFLQTNPTNNKTGHPFMFNGSTTNWNNFVTSATKWITLEK
jgi:hypothetical protein